MYYIAAGNVLLLRNNVDLSPDIAEVSLEKLLSLVAEQLIDTNSNVNVRLRSDFFFSFFVWILIISDIHSFVVYVILTFFLIVL